MKYWKVEVCTGGQWHKVASAHTVEEGRAYLRATGRAAPRESRTEHMVKKIETEPRPDGHKKTGKLVRASDEQWAAWQREANATTAGNLNAFMVNAADSLAASAKTARLRANKVRFRK